MFSIFKKQEKRDIKMPAHLSRADQKEIREIIKRAENSVLDLEEYFLEVLLMFGKKFCAALCTSLAISSAAPKVDAVSGIAVFNGIVGGLQALIGAAEIIGVGVLGPIGAWDDVILGKKENGPVFHFVTAVGGNVLGVPNLFSGISNILNAVVASDTKENGQDVKKLSDDMKIVKVGIAYNSKAKK